MAETTGSRAVAAESGFWWASTETTASPQHKLHWLSGPCTGSVCQSCTCGRLTVFLDGLLLLFTSDQVKHSDQIRLPFGEGKTSRCLLGGKQNDGHRSSTYGGRLPAAVQLSFYLGIPKAAHSMTRLARKSPG